MTPEERLAINALKQLAETWPKSLWLFSANGHLWVMRYKENGERAMDGTGMDRKYAIAEIHIDNDGGDW